MASLDRHWPAFLDLVRAPGSTEVLFGFVAKLVDEAIGSKLTTASLFEVAAGRSRRVFTQNAAAYPVGGFKPIPANKWTDIVVVGQQMFTALSIEAIAEVLFDWELIRSLGCESITNIPVVVGGETVGAVNILHDAGYYTAERLSRVPELMPFATMAFLVALREQREPNRA